MTKLGYQSLAWGHAAHIGLLFARQSGKRFLTEGETYRQTEISCCIWDFTGTRGSGWVLSHPLRDEDAGLGMDG